MGSNLMKSAKLAEPRKFLNVGDIGEIDGRYYRLDCINDLRHIAYFTEINVHKLKYSNGCVEVIE
jgi:hypothetical protein